MARSNDQSPLFTLYCQNQECKLRSLSLVTHCSNSYGIKSHNTFPDRETIAVYII